MLYSDLFDREVVLDEEIDMHYDILMTKVDVKLGEFGLYNFYKMQVGFKICHQDTY